VCQKGANFGDWLVGVTRGRKVRIRSRCELLKLKLVQQCENSSTPVDRERVT